MNMDVLQNLLSTCQMRVRMFSAETYERYDDSSNQWVRIDNNPSLEDQINSWLSGDGGDFTVVTSNISVDENTSSETDSSGVKTWFRHTRRESILMVMSRFDYVRMQGISQAIALTAMVPKSLGDSYLNSVVAFIQQGMVPSTPDASPTPVGPVQKGNRIATPFIFPNNSKKEQQ